MLCTSPQSQHASLMTSPDLTLKPMPSTIFSYFDRRFFILVPFLALTLNQNVAVNL